MNIKKVTNLYHQKLIERLKQLSLTNYMAVVIIACVITLSIIILIEVSGGMSPERWMRI